MEEQKNTPTPSGELVTKVQGRHAFVYERLLVRIARETEDHGSIQCTKSELANDLGCCIASLDRGVRRLRERGYITSELVYGENGAQLGNVYRATADGLAAASVLQA